MKINALATVFSDPIVVHPGGWGSALPEWIRAQIIVERLAAVDAGTDAEACAYLFTAAFTAPLDDDWAEIFQYVTGRVMEAVGRSVPEDLKVRDLGRYRQELLTGLKSWLYDRRTKAGREKSAREVVDGFAFTDRPGPAAPARVPAHTVRK